MAKQDVAVSIICTAYNHEKYISQCLDGFLMQKTTFPFEVIVHDDASTDHTAEIIRKYQREYPDIIKPVYQTENQYQKANPIIKNIMLPLAKGKYAAICEGDDFWTDPNKLQRQFEAMEAHQECALCVCKVRGVSEDGQNTIGFFPEQPLEEGVIPSRVFISMVADTYPFQTSGYFIRMADFRRFYSDEVTFHSGAPVGDVPMMLYFGHVGPVFYCSEEMSHYRMNSLSSIARRKKLNANKTRVGESMLMMINKFDQFTNYMYADSLERCRNRYQIRKLCNEGKYLTIIIKHRDWMALLNRKQQLDIVLNAFAPHLYPAVYNLYADKIKPLLK